MGAGHGFADSGDDRTYFDDDNEGRFMNIVGRHRVPDPKGTGTCSFRYRVPQAPPFICSGIVLGFVPAAPIPGVMERLMKVDFRSDDPAEVQRFLEDIYAGNRFRFKNADRDASARIVGGRHGTVAIYDVFYSAPFEFLSEGDRGSYLIVTGTAGEGGFWRGRERFRCASRAGGIVSSSGESRVRGEASLGHVSVHIDAERMAEHCARWIGRPIDRPLVFEQRPMSAELLRHWQQAIDALQCVSRMEWAPAPALQALTEHAMSLLVGLHPHNYSAYLATRSRFGKKQVREARWILEHAASPMTESALAAQMGCTIPELVAGFSRHEPAGELRRLLEATWSASGPRGDMDAGRDTVRAASAKHGELNPTQCAEVENLLRRRLTDDIGVADMARVAGLGTQHFIERFRNTYGTTPGQYLIRERVQHAKRLLAETSLSIAAIAAESGFSSHSHLTDRFTRRMGIGPSEYRRRRRGQAT